MLPGHESGLATGVESGGPGIPLIPTADGDRGPGGKGEQAPEVASDEFMYQDRKEAERELEVARKIKEDIPPALRKEDIKYRIWNPFPYHRYRGSDDPEE